MPLDDRDRNFEKALARHLRREAPGEACPETESLAAYHERSLEPEEMMRWKHHIISCAHCQEVLAQLEKTEGIPLNAELVQAETEIPVFEIPVLGKSAPPVELARSPQLEAKAVRAARPELPRADLRAAAVPAEMPARKRQWRWVVPAGAIAAGLLIWMASIRMHEVQKPVEIAVNRQPVAQAPGASAPSTTADRQSGAMEDSGQAVMEYKRADTEPKSREETKTQPAAPARTPQELNLQKEQRAGALAENRAAVEPKLQEEAKTKQKNADQELYEFNLRKEQAAGAGKRADAITQQLSQLKVSKPQVPAGAASRISLPKDEPLPTAVPETLTADKERDQFRAMVAAAPPPAPAPEEKALKKNEVGRDVTALSESQGVTGNLRGKQVFAKPEGVTTRSIRTPGGQSQWIISSKGLILHSPDGGISWKGQQSSANAALIAGSAPSEMVCWIVGAQGTILLTTDGGEHWEKLTSPTTADLIGVSARDAQNAAIWSDLRLPRFVTRDGGKTWQSADNQ